MVHLLKNTEMNFVIFQDREYQLLNREIKNQHYSQGETHFYRMLCALVKLPGPPEDVIINSNSILKITSTSRIASQDNNMKRKTRATVSETQLPDVWLSSLKNF